MDSSRPGELSVRYRSAPVQEPLPASLTSRWNDGFTRTARATSNLLGSPWAFLLAALTVAVWASVGPLVGFSASWQLVINTGTTIVTFLMVFLIQNTQNRDSKAFHLKLDELLSGSRGARTGMVQLEDLTDEELRRLHDEFQVLREQHPLAEATADAIEKAVGGELEERQAGRA